MAEDSANEWRREGKLELGHAHSIQKHASFFHLGQFKLQSLDVTNRVTHDVR